MTFFKFVILLIIPVVASSKCGEILETMKKNDRFVCFSESGEENFYCNLQILSQFVVGGDLLSYNFEKIKSAFDPCLSDETTKAEKSKILQDCGDKTHGQSHHLGGTTLGKCLLAAKFFD